jgi:uncharacterized protein (DUF1501 family)
VVTDPENDACCPEFAAMSRRSVLRGALALGGATFMVGSATVSASASSPTPASSVLVVLSLRGGADGLSLVVPYGDPGYYAARPTIAVPQAQLLAGTTDGFFGLHPRLAPLQDLWTTGKLGVIHAAGLTTANRSHFSAMEEVEEAHPGSSARVGWLNRLVGAASTGSPLQGVGIVNGTPPTELSGPVPLMTIDSLDDATIAADDQWDTDPAGKRRRSLHTLWDHDGSAMGTAVRATLQATADITPAVQAADNKASYGGSHLGAGLAAAARIIRGNVGTEVITVDQGDWDMHTDLGNLAGGRMIGHAEDLATALAAFFADLGDQAGKVTLVTISEFGRRVLENGNRGLDHGWGNVMFVAGAGVKGGHVYVDQQQGWKPLSDDLESDLHVTTDYRDVLAEIVATRFGRPVSTVFPGLTPTTLGFMQST